jgi:hypothetical protein
MEQDATEMVQVAEVVARDQACYDVDMEATLLAERACWDAAMAKGQTRQRWEEGRHGIAGARGM